MGTLSIEEISKTYNEQVKKYNHNIRVKKHLKRLGFYNESIENYKKEYKLCFLLKTQNKYGIIENILNYGFEQKPKTYSIKNLF